MSPSKHYTEGLLYTWSEDGLRLDGIAIAPSDAPHPVAVVWVHGLNANFHTPPAVDVGRALAKAGHLVILGNNRGHDFGAEMRDRSDRPICAGGGWERFHESPYDISPWIDLAIDRGAERVVLLGHGLGGRKAVYYQTERNDPRVAGVVVASTGLGYPLPDREMLARADAMVAEGRGRDLLGWPPIGCSVSAQSFIDRERTYQKFFHTSGDDLPIVSQLTTPLFAFYGATEDIETRLRENLRTIRRNATGVERFDSWLVPGTDQIYTGRELDVADRLVEWIVSL